MSASEAPEVRSRAARTAATATALRAMDGERLVGAIADAARTLASPESEVGASARELLPGSTGLTAEMVGWAIEHQVAIATPEAIGVLARSMRAPRDGAVPARARLSVAVLAGNVFTAALGAITLPLLARVPVVVKASSRDDLFPRLFVEALRQADAEVGASVDVLTFRGGTTSLEDALFAQAEVVSAYGSDSTLAEIRARLPATTTFVAHGHGIGAIWVPAEALPDPGAARELAERIAIDVAAYDQRGCLSPHAIWVQRGAPVGGAALAEMIADHGLFRLSRELPRGPLPVPVGAAQVQWRGVAAARGELFERDGWAVSFEGDGPLRLSPGWRNVSVLECVDADELGRRLAPLGVHLKALGIAAPPDGRRAVAHRLPAPLAPRVSAVGDMQRPPLDSLADGQPAHLGLIRWTQLD